MAQQEQVIQNQFRILYQTFLYVYKDYLPSKVTSEQIKDAIKADPYIPVISVNVYLAGIFATLTK